DCGRVDRGCRGSTCAAYCIRLMHPTLFLPTARQMNGLILIALLSLGEALYLRYLAIEYAPVSLACQAGLNTWLCASFRLTIVLFNHSAFGWVALGAAQSAAAVDPAPRCSARRQRVRPGLAQRQSRGPRRRAADAQPGTPRACSRVNASASKVAENHTACQLAKPSLQAI